MIQCPLYVIGHKKDNHQRTDCGKQRSQNSQKSTSIVVITVMIGHHDNRIYHDTERNSNPCQRNQIQFNIKQVVKNNGYQHVGKQGKGNDRKIASASADNPDKQEQYHQG